MGENEFCLCFVEAPGIGPKKFRDIISYFKSSERAWKATKEEYKKAGIGEKTFEAFREFRKNYDVKPYIKKLQDASISYISILDNLYPPELKKIDGPPVVLFYRGDISVLSLEKKIAVVGTRKMTNYGREVTEKLTEDLVYQGFVIVSGLALGVDATAHRMAIENNGKTIAVLGSGINLCFPSENKAIYDRIIKDCGVVVSEYGFDVLPSQGTFPSRNRIISGLSLAVLVTEAGEDSGSLITAEDAKKAGRKVFAVPGPITSSLSTGTLKLLKQGAILVQNSQDILSEFGLRAVGGKEKFDIENLDLSEEEKLVFKTLENEEFSIDELAIKTNMKTFELLTIISEMEVKGLVENESGVIRIKF